MGELKEKVESLSQMMETTLVQPLCCLPPCGDQVVALALFVHTACTLCCDTSYSGPSCQCAEHPEVCNYAEPRTLRLALVAC
jgi:hypothetical protein